MGEDLDCDLEASREAMHQLHPRYEGELPALPESAEEVVIDAENLERVVKQHDTGASPGPSGWTMSMVRSLIGSPECWRALCLLISDIVNGRLQGCEDILLGSTLVPIPKSGGL